MQNFDKDYLTAKETKQLFNVTDPTLYQWRKKNKIEYVKISDKKFLYKTKSVMKLLNINNEQEKPKQNVIYCRVSTQKQKSDLNKQKQILLDYCNSNGIIPDKIFSEIASGMNEDRKELNRLINMVVNKEVNTIYITYKDRLTRFGFKYFENIFKMFNTKIVVLNNQINPESFEQELTDDLIAIIHHFSMKMYSKRRCTLKQIEDKLK